jgi:hypothetical protein
MGKGLSSKSAYTLGPRIQDYRVTDAVGDGLCLSYVTALRMLQQLGQKVHN